MIYPKFLSKSGTIGVPAPSAGARDELKKNRYTKATETFKELGYDVIKSKNINKSHYGRSALARIRGKEITDMFQNKDIDFLLCASGGEFAVECLPYVDFEIIKKYPKWIAGFSDPTTVLFPLTTKYDIATIYGHNFSNFGSKELHKSERDFLEVIKGNVIKQDNYDLYEDEGFERKTGLEGYNLTKKVKWKTLDNKDATIDGRIIGGCLDIIAELSGTKYDGMNIFNEKYKKDGIIWYFDNCELSMEEFIRVMWRFKELDYFKYTKAIILGRFGVEISNQGYDIKTCLKDSVLSELKVPIIYDADISHKGPCLTIINGSICHIETKKGKENISFMLK